MKKILPILILALFFSCNHQSEIPAPQVNDVKYPSGLSDKSLKLIMTAYEFGYFQGAQKSALGLNAGRTFSEDSTDFANRFIQPLKND